MRNVIPFPNKNAQKRKTLIKEKDILSNRKDFLILKEFEFTCPHCETVGKFKQENIVFKRIQLYCGGCGNAHTITNPAFGKDTNESFKKY